MDDNSTNNAHYRQLAEKLLKGTITPEEEALFEKWYADFNDEEIELKKKQVRILRKPESGYLPSYSQKDPSKKNQE